MRTFSPPPPPNSFAEAGLEQGFTEDLVLRHLFSMGDFRIGDLVERVKLPVSLVEYMLEELRSGQLLEIKGAASYTRASYVFRLTEAGRRKAQEALKFCRYAGPAPVSLSDYCRMVQAQSVKGALGTEEALKKALSHLVLSETMLRRLGPAMYSGQAVMVYGPSGNGKTSIAEAIGRALPDHVYIPYAIAVGGQVISVYDPSCHEAVAGGDEQEHDSRWVLIKRPVIIVGGELTLKMLDIGLDPISRCYDGSLQMKANNGVFILDDFGRQQVEPIRILNRWIVPLERKVDHMTLQTGMKMVIPFDVLVIISTEMEPKDLVHEAFLRRLHYKIKIDRPTEDEFREIFKGTCESQGIAFSEDAYEYLNEQWYKRNGLARNACHPRDIIDLIVNHSSFFAKPPELTVESVKAACTDYFIGS